MVSEWINNRPETPAIGVRNRRSLNCAGANGPCANRRGIFHDLEHSNRASTQRLRTEVEVLRGFFGNPELRAGYRQLNNTAAVNTVQLARAHFLTNSVADTEVRKPLDDLSNPAFLLGSGDFIFVASVLQPPFSAIRAFTSFRTRAAGNGLSA